MKLLSVVSEESWSAIRAECEAKEVDAGLLGRLVEARIRMGGAGNRRSLFGEFDKLFDGSGTPAGGIPATARPGLSGGTSAVQLRSLTLQNWKVFRHAEIHCPPHDPKKPIVLLGGKNGSGKTSLLEALLFGLYGMWASGCHVSDQPTFRRRTYRHSVESAFHRRARSQGESVMSVALAFDTSEGPIRIERRWYFGDDGSFVEDDEEVILHVGEDADVLAVPDGTSPNEFYQDEIARRLLPPALAPFFFFDGEQVKRLGERNLSEQVRLGVESLLGAHVLRDTVCDLRDYAKDRFRDAGTEKLEIEGRRSREIADLEERESAILECLAALEAELNPSRARRDTLIGELGALAGGSYADLQELLEQRKRNEVDQTHIRQAIVSCAAEELPLVIAGRPLREALIQRLRQEEASEVSSEFGSRHEEALEAFLRAFSAQAPPLETDLMTILRGRIRAAWRTWSGPGRTEEIRHHYIVGRSRAGVLNRLSRAETEHTANTEALIGNLSQRVKEGAELTRLIEQQRDRSERRESLIVELEALTAMIETKEAERRQFDRDLGELRSTLLPRREEERLRQQKREAGVPAFRRGSSALRMANGIEQTIMGVIPAYFEALAEAVTRSYRALAHKEMIERIEIKPDGEVVLIDRSGCSVQDLAASAGERHIFAMALMAAVADLSGCELPIVMDTPLGRLDSEHRFRILKFFSARENQTILLAQPDEIHGQYLAQIDSRIAARYHLNHEVGMDGPGESVLNEGYLPLVAV